MRRLPILCAILALAGPALALAPDDQTPRTAIISAFGPELIALEAATTDKRAITSGGTTFTTGVLDGKPVVLFLSGMSMVNAAMTTQLALDRFHIARIVVSGIAGGVDPGLDVGDVVVADQWAQYLESRMARQIASGKFERPADMPEGEAAFRSLSDLAGGDPGKNQARVFFQLASDNAAATVRAFVDALP